METNVKTKSVPTVQDLEALNQDKRRIDHLFEYNKASLNGEAIDTNPTGLFKALDKGKYEYKKKPVSDPGSTITITSDNGDSKTVVLKRKNDD